MSIARLRTFFLQITKKKNTVTPTGFNLRGSPESVIMSKKSKRKPSSVNHDEVSEIGNYLAIYLNKKHSIPRYKNHLTKEHKKVFKEMISQTCLLRERLRCLRQFLRMRDDRLPKIVLVRQPPRVKQKRVVPEKSARMSEGKIKKKNWENIKRNALNRLGWRRSMRSYVGLRRRGAVLSYY